MNRVEEYPIPETALREAVLNAIAHKDYGGNTPIQISVYDDRIMIWNQGQLPENWTIARLLKKHPSVPYNPAIANTFFRAGLIEAWGSGTFRIIDDCANANVPAPIFEYDFSDFLVDFTLKNENALKGALENAPESALENSEKIMMLMKKQPKITSTELAQKIGISARAVQKHIRQLQLNNRIRRNGSTKSGVWEILESS